MTRPTSPLSAGFSLRDKPQSTMWRDGAPEPQTPAVSYAQRKSHCPPRPHRPLSARVWSSSPNPLCDPSFPRPATFLNLLKYLTLFLGPSLGLTINCASPRYSLLGLHPSAFPPGGSFSPSLTIHKALHSLSTHLPQTHCPGSHLSPRLELPSCFEHLSNSLPAAPAPLGPGPGPLPALL